MPDFTVGVSLLQLTVLELLKVSARVHRSNHILGIGFLVGEHPFNAVGVAVTLRRIANSLDDCLFCQYHTTSIEHLSSVVNITAWHLSHGLTPASTLRLTGLSYNICRFRARTSGIEIKYFSRTAIVVVRVASRVVSIQITRRQVTVVSVVAETEAA